MSTGASNLNASLAELTGDPSQVPNSTFLQPTGFRILIDRNNYPNLEFFAQSVSHPSISLPAVETGYKNIATLPMPGDKLDYGELSVQALMDENMAAYTEVYRWMERIIEVPQRSDVKLLNNVREDHTADITVSVLSSHNNQIKQIRYIDAHPTLMGDVLFESTVGDVQYITFPVSFRFSYFRLV